MIALLCTFDKGIVMGHAVKQVLVVRKDLNMRKGKIGAQCAHASMGCVFPREAVVVAELNDDAVTVTTTMTRAQFNWFMELSVKIVVGAADEAELMDIYAQAQALGLPCVLIQDAGFTEFGGVPTYTAVGIGPAEANLIDPITGRLPLM